MDVKVLPPGAFCEMDECEAGLIGRTLSKFERSLDELSFILSICVLSKEMMNNDKSMVNKIRH